VRLENSFDVQASADAAWATLNDVPRIVPCMPGATLEEVVDENTWKATLHVKLGPISLRFATDLSRAETDEENRRVVLLAKARELKGRGGAQANIESSLAEADGATHVSIVTDLSLQGAVAQYGRGIVADVAGQLTSQFADCIGKQLAQETPAADSPGVATETKPVGGLRMGLAAAWRSFLRLFRRNG
jgi:uncharacterized protein